MGDRGVYDRDKNIVVTRGTKVADVIASSGLMGGSVRRVYDGVRHISGWRVCSCGEIACLLVTTYRGAATTRILVSRQPLTEKKRRSDGTIVTGRAAL
jgi:hypothetical protein